MSNTIVVIGAGAAGLATAYWLRKKGFEPIVLEAKDSAGGRLAGESINGFNIDTGAQFFSTTYDRSFELCNELGLTYEGIAPSLAFLGKTKLHEIRTQKSPSALFHNLRTILSFDLLPPRALWQAIKVYRAIKPIVHRLNFTEHELAVPLDSKENFGEWVERVSGREILETFLQPLMTSLTLSQPEELGACFGQALLADTITGFSTPKLGIGMLAKRLEEELGSAIKLNTTVEQVIVQNGKVKGVETNSGFLSADIVVSAAPANRACQYLTQAPDALQKKLAAVTYSSCHHVVFCYDATIPFEWLGALIPRSANNGIAAFSSGAAKTSYLAPKGKGMIQCFLTSEKSLMLRDANDDEICKSAMEDLLKILPTMSPDYEFAKVYRWAEAQCNAPPGMLREMLDLRKNGNGLTGLYLAGEYMGMPSLNGAIQSGFNTAKEIAVDLQPNGK